MAHHALANPSSSRASRVGKSAPAARKIGPTPQETTELSVARFLRSFQAMQAAGRLYQKNHPLVFSALETTELHLRAALTRVSPVFVGLEDGVLVYCPTKGAEPIPLESKEAWSGTGKSWARCGISSLQFLPQTNLGDLDELGRLMNAAGPRNAEEWPARIAERRIMGIRVNLPLRHRVGAVLATLVSALLGNVGSNLDAPRSVAPAAPGTFEDLTAALRVLARFESIVSRAAQSNPQQTAETIHMALSDAEPRTIKQLMRAMASHAPRENEPSDKYLTRIAERLLMETLTAQFLSGRVVAAEIRGVFSTLLDALVRAMISPRQKRSK